MGRLAIAVGAVALIFTGCCANPYWWPGGRNYPGGVPVHSPPTVFTPSPSDVYYDTPIVDQGSATRGPTPALPTPAP